MKRKWASAMLSLLSLLPTLTLLAGRAESPAQGGLRADGVRAERAPDLDRDRVAVLDDVRSLAERPGEALDLDQLVGPSREPARDAVGPGARRPGPFRVHPPVVNPQAGNVPGIWHG